MYPNTLELLSQHKTSIYPCALELVAQHKTSHQSCDSWSMPNTRKHIYIICNWITPNISNKSSCSYAVGSLTQYIKIKHHGNIIINGAHAHKCYVKNLGYYIPPRLEQPGVLGTQNEIMKQGGVSLSHGGFILPTSLISFKVLPLHFQLD